MAFQDNGSWAVTFTFEDNNGNAATTQVYYPGVKTEAEVQTAASALAAAMQDCSSAWLKRFTLSRVYESDQPSAATQESEVERKLNIPLGTVGRAVAVNLQLPSPLFAYELPFSDYADPTVGDLGLLLSLLTNGSIGPGNGIVTHYGADITRLSTPFYSHRNRKPNK